ncbi:MAG: hypothetical protein U0795_19840 [Pirellulales bacterium]
MDHRRHVATSTDKFILESRINGIQHVTRFTWFFQSEEHRSDLQKRSWREELDVKARDRQILPGSARHKRKAFGDQLVEYLSVPNADSPLGAKVLRVVSPVTGKSLGRHPGFGDRQFGNPARGNGN